MKSGWLSDLGLISYQKAWNLQKELILKRQKDLIPDTVLLCQHPPVYTLGKGGKQEHLLADRNLLNRLGAEYVPIDRGGDITFHGPGQLVVYPILKLRDLGVDLHQYLRGLEECSIQTLSQYGVQAGREKGLTGVWVNGAKIAAIGVRLSRWVSMHGIAVNINTEMRYFKHIVPCGIASKPVTSLENLLGRRVPLEDFSSKFAAEFEKEFQLGLKLKPQSEILQTPTAVA